MDCESMKFREGYAAELALRNRLTGQHLADTMTAQGVYLLIGIGSVYHEECEDKGKVDVIVAVDDKLDDDDPAIAQLLGEGMKLVQHVNNLQFELSESAALRENLGRK